MKNFLKLAKKDIEVLDEVQYRIDNKFWIRKTQLISLKVLDKMDKLKISKEELSVKTTIPVDEIELILSGKENLSLKTICLLEKALDINILK